MTTTIELDADTATRLDDLAARTGKDKAALIRMLIEDSIEDAARADEIWNRVLHGEEKTFTEAELRAEFDLKN